MQILQICPPHLSDAATFPWEIQKVIFTSIIHTYFCLFTLPHKKLTVIHLPTSHENVTTLTCELQNFFYPTEGLLSSFESWRF